VSNKQGVTWLDHDTEAFLRLLPWGRWGSFCLFVVVGIEPRASGRWGKRLTTEVHQPQHLL
jgi:hypothetical protein